MDGGLSGAPNPWPLPAYAAAAALGVSERTVRRAIARGELRVAKHAGVFRIAPGEPERSRGRRSRAGPRVLADTASAPRPPDRRRGEPAPIPLPDGGARTRASLPTPLNRLVAGSGRWRRWSAWPGATRCACWR